MPVKKDAMKIALVQMDSVIGDFEGNVGKIVELSGKAMASQGRDHAPDLVVFPELVVCGYPPMDLLDQATFVERNLSALRALQKALPSEAAVAVGYVDKNRSGSGRSLVNAYSVIFGGKIVFTQTKTLLPTYDVFDEARYFEPAKTRKVFTPTGGRIGFAICEDFWWEAPPSPSFKYEVDPVKDLLDSSIDLLIVPSASPFVTGKIETRLALARGSTSQGRIPVLYCNAVGANDSLVFDGRSFAMRPDGSLAGICGWGEEILLFDTGSLKAESMTLEGARAGSVSPATLKIDAPVEEQHKAIVAGIRDYMRKSGFEKACLGLSGGIDSALIAILAAEAIGASNIACLSMPSRFSSEG